MTIILESGSKIGRVSNIGYRISMDTNTNNKRKSRTFNNELQPCSKRMKLNGSDSKLIHTRTDLHRTEDEIKCKGNVNEIKKIHINECKPSELYHKLKLNWNVIKEIINERNSNPFISKTDLISRIRIRMKSISNQFENAEFVELIENTPFKIIFTSRLCEEQDIHNTLMSVSSLKRACIDEYVINIISEYAIGSLMECDNDQCCEEILTLFKINKSEINTINEKPSISALKFDDNHNGYNMMKYGSIHQYIEKDIWFDTIYYHRGNTTYCAKCTEVIHHCDCERNLYFSNDSNTFNICRGQHFYGTGIGKLCVDYKVSKLLSDIVNV